MEQIIIDIMNQFGYLGIMFLIAVENIFPPIPSEVILTFGGFMTTYTNLNIILIILFATLGALIGAMVLYLIGRILKKERLIALAESKVGKTLRFKKEDIEKADAWFTKKEAKAVFFCRFIPIVRSLISIPAGINGMKVPAFLLYTFLGTLIWNTALAVAGKLLGENWPKLVEIINTYSKVVLVILIILFIIAVVFFYKTRKKKK